MSEGEEEARLLKVARGEGEAKGRRAYDRFILACDELRYGIGGTPLWSAMGDVFNRAFIEAYQR